MAFTSFHMAWGHGEDKPGPHGGFIRMPGAFHTEVVPQSARKIKIHLLDMSWKNPTVKDSEVVVTHQAAKKVTKALCTAQADHFVCEFARGVDLRKNGELIVTARREGQQGNAASYALPLSWPESAKGHDRHH
ncbi:MAG: hypothetical protein KF865_03045 [Bdellovibrionaceae bacterium]|nr:hypothetical protein [Pseudobdellovibrionaceae bacterium]